MRRWTQRVARGWLTGWLLVALLTELLVGSRPLWEVSASGVTFPAWQSGPWQPRPESWVCYPPVRWDADQTDRRAGPFQPPGTAGHPLGTDELGRDVLARLLYGARFSWLVSVLGMALATVLGVVLGATAGLARRGGGQMVPFLGRVRVADVCAGVPAAAWVLFYGFYRTRFAWADLLDGQGQAWLPWAVGWLTAAAGGGAGWVLSRYWRRAPWGRRRVALPVDGAISRLIEIMLSLPKLFLLLVLLTALRPSDLMLAVVLGLTSWMGVARLVQTGVWVARGEPYADSARLLGTPPHRLLLDHLLPNVLLPVRVAAAFGVAELLLVASALSFLGVGTEQAGWGGMLAAARGYGQAWWLALWPGGTLFLTILAWRTVGDGWQQAGGRLGGATRESLRWPSAGNAAGGAAGQSGSRPAAR